MTTSNDNWEPVTNYNTIRPGDMLRIFGQEGWVAGRTGVGWFGCFLDWTAVSACTSQGRVERLVEPDAHPDDVDLVRSHKVFDRDSARRLIINLDRQRSKRQPKPSDDDVKAVADACLPFLVINATEAASIVSALDRSRRNRGVQ